MNQMVGFAVLKSCRCMRWRECEYGHANSGRMGESEVLRVESFRQWFTKTHVGVLNLFLVEFLKRDFLRIKKCLHNPSYFVCLVDSHFFYF